MKAKPHSQNESPGIEISKEQFIATLIKAGWKKHEAEQEWEDIQNDEEGIP